ncbi:NB-ARC domain-containing protein, partial [Sphaerothrix gracilis]|uniref:NB-ARC domain-containing protein n=1 Tax=Sphaerothrix gracilis TaxID=3151835 RepID=UPI0031FE1AF1
MIAKKSRRRGVVLSLQGQHKLEAARRQLEKTLNDGDRLTLEELSDRTRLALSTVIRVLDAQLGVDKQTLDQFFAAFDLLLERTDYQHPHLVPDPLPTSSPEPPFPPAPCSSVQPTVQPTRPAVDWGEAIDVSLFYGRTPELVTLQTWIQQDRCRLIALLGMGGIGKTALSVKLGQSLATAGPRQAVSFDFIVWRTLRNAPPLESLLADLIQVLSHQQETAAALPSERRLPRLMQVLQRQRCLLILDNCETLLQEGQFAGAFRPEYAAYGELLRQVGELPHQSALVLTSREKPQAIASLEGAMLPVRSLPLRGLPASDT